MQKVLLKRTVRDFRQNLLRYLALAALIILGMYMVVGLVAAADTVIIGTENNWKENKLEDGEFTVLVPLTAEEEQKLKDEGICLERMFSLDFNGEKGSVLRVFINRQEINLITLDEGWLAEGAEELVLEKRYCEEHGIEVGDKIELAGKAFRVTGIGSVPDYDAAYKSLADSSVDSEAFGLAFVDEKAYEELKASGKSVEAEVYQYSYRLNGKLTDDALKSMLKEFRMSAELPQIFSEAAELMDSEGFGSGFSEGIGKLTEFLKAEDNPRIGAGADDQIINKVGGLIAGVIVMILFTYVISVFVIHTIDSESSVIGALYALGVKKRDLMLHYLMLPAMVTFTAGCIGAVLGFSRLGVNYQMKECYDYFSVPDFPVVYPAYLIAYSVVMPVATALLVNCAVIHKRLSKPVLGLIRNEQKNGKVHHLNLGSMGFIAKFRIRQMLREARTSFTVVAGMFISLLILMLGVNCYAMCRHISIDNKADTKFEYMYTYKFPAEEAPDGGEVCFAKTLKKEVLGYNLDVTLMGIDGENPYFDAEIRKGTEQVVVSSAMAEKYNLEEGDTVVLTDEEEEKDYTFTVAGIAPYSVSFYAFMDIDSMRELLRADEDYYNVVMSDKELDIDSALLYAVTTKEDISKASDVFINMMKPFITMMCGIAAVIFCVVMYLMLKVVIDRSAFHISLIKIFGYRTKEVKKLYLNGNFYIIAAAAAICIPLAKLIMDKMYPYLVSNVACGMNLKFGAGLYVLIYAAVIICYLVINQLLVGRLKKMVPAEVLKHRE